MNAVYVKLILLLIMNYYWLYLIVILLEVNLDVCGMFVSWYNRLMACLAISRLIIYH